jgi:flagellar FliL protein
MFQCQVSGNRQASNLTRTLLGVTALAREVRRNRRNHIGTVFAEAEGWRTTVMAENTKEEEKPAAKAPEGPSKLIPMILIANTVLMGVVLAVVLLRKPAAGNTVATPAPQSAAHGAPPAAAAAEGGKDEKAEHGEGAGHGESAAAADPNGAPGPILKLENFIIQLRGTDTDRYVRVAFDLELGSEGDRALVQARMPHIRDAIISYFSDRSLDELRGSEGMDRIKAAVLKKLDDILAAHRVRSVFITELVIQ